MYTPTRMVSFDALTAASIKLYSNPATNVANVLLSPGLINRHMVINMMDIKGNVVKQWKLPNNAQPQLQLNLVGLPKGTYLLHFWQPKSEQHTKFNHPINRTINSPYSP